MRTISTGMPKAEVFLYAGRKAAGARLYKAYELRKGVLPSKLFVTVY